MKSHRKKLRVLHYCNQLSLGGTERTMEIFCRNLDREKFEVHALSRAERRPWAQELRLRLSATIGVRSAKNKLLQQELLHARAPRFRSFLGNENVHFAASEADLAQWIETLAPDILHVHYSGNPEPPLTLEAVVAKIPVIVTTNQFEKENTSPSHRHVKKMCFVSRWLLENKAPWAKTDPRARVLYNPIELPFSDQNLRAELGIPSSAFVVGRIGRPDDGIHSPIALDAFARIEDDHTWFLAVAPPRAMLQQARELGLRNFRALGSTTDAERLSKFYNTIDVLAHARRDGETFGCNIAEAMIHSKPVVSHLTPFMNAQTEIIGDTGAVVGEGDVDEYSRVLKAWRSDRTARERLGQKARTRALEQFEAALLTRELEKEYLALYKVEEEKGL